MADDETPIEAPDPGGHSDDPDVKGAAEASGVQRSDNDPDGGSEELAPEGSVESAQEAESEQEPQVSEVASGAAESKPARSTARVAAVAVGAVLASAAAIAGAVWAISAIVGEDDYYYDCCYVDYATSGDPEGSWEPEFGRGFGAEHERRGWSERESREPFERDRREQADRRKKDRQERRELAEREEREERDRNEHAEPGESADSGHPVATEECETVLSFGTGEDAVTVLICNAPRTEWREDKPGAKPGDDRGDFDFRDRPRDSFPFSPYFGWKGDGWPFEGDGRPFGRGPAPSDRDGWPFEGDGRPFGRGPMPFEGDGWPFEGGLPYDFKDLFGDGEGGFWFGSDGNEDGFCFGQGDDTECFSGLDSDLDRLSDEEREQLERMMEMFFSGFGPESFFDGLEGFFEGLEFELPESSTDPPGAASA